MKHLEKTTEETSQETTREHTRTHTHILKFLPLTSSFFYKRKKTSDFFLFFFWSNKKQQQLPAHSGEIKKKTKTKLNLQFLFRSLQLYYISQFSRGNPALKGQNLQAFFMS